MMTKNFDQREFVYRILLIIFLVGLALALWSLRGAIMLLFLGAILATALSIPVSFLRKRGLSNGQAVLITVIGTLTAILLVGVLIIPSFVQQAGNLVDRLPNALDEANTQYNQFAKDSGLLPTIETGADNLQQKQISNFIRDQADNATGQVLPFLGTVGSIIGNLLILFVLTVYFLAEPTDYVEGVLTLVPRAYRPRALEIITSLGKSVRLAVISQIFSSLLVATFTTIGLFILGVDDALALGILAGFFNFIPNFGPLVSLLVGVIFTLASGGPVVLVIILYLVVQQLESNVITPRIIRQTLSMPGAVVIATQLVAGALFGFLGLLLAVPLVAVIMTIVREMYVYDALNSRKAVILRKRLETGHEVLVVTTDPYRPEQLSPGEAAKLSMQGQDPFEFVQGQQTIEIVGPSTEQMNRVTTNQQAVWVAILALVGAQAISLIQAILKESRRGADR
ncbi:MAG: AI-2E family transporter [Chloroflexota bacterium]|nr:AI-2E family transporter [Chloroflexota bacterium]NOG63435.1 AI-2E family transporter [Chloroflexota bacterium]GIK62294.1 MAG: AI-2E family transporter [Chloroflexota bacterium]